MVDFKVDGVEKPLKLYTMQLNQRQIDSFQHTKIESDFVIFKKTAAEREIFKKIRRKDCFMEILKPNLGYFLIKDRETSMQFKKALDAYAHKRFEEAEKRVHDIMIKLRAVFRPGDILISQVRLARRMTQYQPQ